MNRMSSLVIYDTLSVAFTPFSMASIHPTPKSSVFSKVSSRQRPQFIYDIVRGRHPVSGWGLQISSIQVPRGLCLYHTLESVDGNFSYPKWRADQLNVSKPILVIGTYTSIMTILWLRWCAKRVPRSRPIGIGACVVPFGYFAESFVFERADGNSSSLVKGSGGREVGYRRRVFVGMGVFLVYVLTSRKIRWRCDITFWRRRKTRRKGIYSRW